MFCAQAVRLSELHEQYGNRAQFLLVYIRETGIGMSEDHPFPEALREFEEPPGAPSGSRLRLKPRVRAGLNHFHLRFPCLIDNEQAEVEKLYNAWPRRIMILDKTGRIDLDSGNLPSAPFLMKRISDWFDRQSASPS